MFSIASIQISISVKLVRLALIQISITSIAGVCTNWYKATKWQLPKVMGSSGIKPKYCTFNTLLINIYTPSKAVYRLV